MRIDLKNSTNFTIEDVRALLASKDDNENRQLRISEAGEAYLSDEVENLNLQAVKARFETWCAGNDYSGPNAAADDEYVQSVCLNLRAVWERGLRGFIDYDPRYD
jgi:hypothetical protein